MQNTLGIPREIPVNLPAAALAFHFPQLSTCAWRFVTPP
jgi:hypothetical protein